MTFQPFPLDFGDWEQLSFKQSYKGRDQDGFVVASINYGQDGARGLVVGWQVVNGMITKCAGSSVHWNGSEDATKVATESFCMPVVKGAEFGIDLENTSGSIDGSAFWIPMGSSHRMLPLANYNVNEVNQAQTHGILTGLISQDDQRPTFTPPPTSIMFLQTAATQSFTDANTLGVATVEFCSGWDKWIRCNSATAVVAKGSWFKAALAIHPTIPCNAMVSWVGIVPA